MEVSRTGQWTGIGEPVPPRPPLLRSLGKARDSIRGQSNSRPPPPCLRAACIPACVHLCVRFTLNPEGSGLDVHPFLCFRCPQFGILFFSVFSLQLTLSLSFPFPLFWGGGHFIVFVFSFQPHLLLSAQHGHTQWSLGRPIPSCRPSG